MNPDTALAQALAAALKAAPAVAALIADRAYDVAPRNPAYPYAAVTRLESRPFGGSEGDGVEHVVTLTCASRYGGPEEARAVLAAARAALHDARPVVAGRRLVNLRVTYADVFRAAERDLTLGVLRLRAVSETV